MRGTITTAGIVLVAVAALIAASPASRADTYPSRNVVMVVPYPAGGSVDGVARIFAQKLGEVTGQTFIVENRAGASGIVGATYVSRAAPDGYTVMLTASIHVATPFLSKNVPYDVVKDFAPVSLVASGPLLVSTASNVPATTLKEFFQLVRASPDKYTLATSGLGSAGHLAIELLKREAGVETLVVVYKGAAPALNDLMSGQVQLMADPMLSSLPLARSGRIKALAITATKRSSVAPEIPTLEESGMTGFDFESWYGIWTPKGVPSDVLTKLQRDVANVAALPDVKERLKALGFEAIGSSSDRFAAYIDSEMARYKKIIADAHIEAQ